MDTVLHPQSAPFRDARYAPRRLDVERRPNGEIILTNPTPYSTRFQTATAGLDHWAMATPERIWLAERDGDGWRKVRYREGRARVAALAGGLAELGLAGPDARPLLILSRNSVDHALIAYAAMSAGIPAAPVSPQYGLPGAILARLEHALQVIQPAAVFAEDAKLFAAGLSCELLRGLPVIAGRNARPGDIDLDRLGSSGRAAPQATPDHLAKLLLTSGSTGLPKAVMISHRALAINAAQIDACHDDPEPMVVVTHAPWSHSLGGNSVLHVVTQGGGTLYLDAGQPVAGRFDETIRNLSEIPVTFANMVPAAWAMLAVELERNEALARTLFSKLRVMQYGGAPMGQDVCDRIEAVAVRTIGEKVTFSTGYGSTETGPRACSIHWHNDRTGRIGLPIPGTSVKLTPVDGKLELRVKGPQLTAGYYGRPDLTAQAHDDEGFYIVGDAARLVDPADPEQGMVFDGRLSENFKLGAGVFVIVGTLRIAVVSAVGPTVTDAVVCGEGREGLGLLFYPRPQTPRDEVLAAVRAGIERHNVGASVGTRIARALVLDGPPDAAHGEITEKGYVAQALARRLRAAELERLFAAAPETDIMTFD